MPDIPELMRQLEETRVLRERCVGPIYLSLLHANFIGPRHASEAAETQIAGIAGTVTDAEIAKLLEIQEWRGRLVAAWCVGLTKRTAFVGQIASLLLQSKLVYAGQGYCVALGLIGGDACRSHIEDYLREYLPLRGRLYDQLWAIGALAYIDGTPPKQFLDPDLWTEGKQRLDPLKGIDNFRQVVEFLTQHQMIIGS